MRRDLPRARGNSTLRSAALACATCVAFLVLANGATPGVARDLQRENALKAGYLFNFIKFVDWPPLAGDEAFTICFLGAEAIHDELAAVLPGKRLGNRALATRSLALDEVPAGCQVLYVEAARLEEAVRAISLHAPAVLTVSDAGEFLHRGGIIELFAEDNRLRFRINIENAKRANLRISSRLLQLASMVEKER